MTGARAYRIERSPSSRARCRTCGRAISRGVLRFGIPHERPSGLRHLWHHLSCAAAYRRAEVEAAEADGATPEGLAPLPLDELAARAHPREGAGPAAEEVPRVERVEANDARCARCGEAIPRGTLRLVLARRVVYQGVLRPSPFGVHATCAAASLRSEDCAIETEGFVEAVRANTKALPSAEVDAALRAMGQLA